MDDSCGLKRPRPRPQQESLQKRHDTRSTRKSCTATAGNNNNGITSPIRICPPTHSLYFLRLHQLFFHNDNVSEDENQSASSTDIPPTIRFGKMRLQSIYKSPHIYVIDQFLSVADIQYLFTHFVSKFKFQRSFVDEASFEGNRNEEVEEEGVDGNTKRAQQPSKSLHRTSAFLALNKQHDSRIASIEQKVASLFGCATKQIEALQLVRYQSPDQYFHVHHDLGIYDEDSGKVELPGKSIWYQRRMITLFCYLNTVPPKMAGQLTFHAAQSRLYSTAIQPIRCNVLIVLHRLSSWKIQTLNIDMTLRSTKNSRHKI